MDNFDDFENKTYKEAKKIRYGFQDHATYLLRMFYFGLQIFALMLKEIFVNIFFKKEKKNLAGQLALITGDFFILNLLIFKPKTLFKGGANGLGRAIAFRLAKEKCNVIIVDINQPEGEKTAKEIEEKFKVSAVAFKVDVSDFAAIEKLRKDISLHFDQTVDLLFNNAGILSGISLTEGHYTQIQKVIDVNLTSHFWVVLLI